MSGEMPRDAYAILVGLDMTPRSYNQMLAATQAVHRHAQYHEVPLREALRLAACVLVGKTPTAMAAAADKMGEALG